jgi:hypothetical protein
MPGTGGSGRSTKLRQALLEIVRDTDTPPAIKQKAEFAVQLMIDALLPPTSSWATRR